jgi:ABC-type multidrug transport system fused ATPase/permease subunit
VITGLNLEINPGEYLAFVGASGSGKSTIVKLIERFYDVNEGRITIDGEDLREVNVR